MLSVQSQVGPADIDLIVQAYSLFQNALCYQHKNTLFKKSIQNGDQQNLYQLSNTIRIVVNAIRNLLTYRSIENWEHIAAVQKIVSPMKDRLQSAGAIQLNQFSKLLALRFLREVYFEPNYLFATYAQLELGAPLLRIGLFMKESLEEERGRNMFGPQSQLFCSISKESQKSGKVDKQMEVIGFSIHKITLEFLFTCGQSTQYMPFHESWVKKAQKQSEKFHSSFYSVYQRLQLENVQFPSKFHYFKEKDAARYYEQNMKAVPDSRIEGFFTSIFQEIWMIIIEILSKNFDDANMYKYLLTLTESSPFSLVERVLFCSKLALNTFDRHFWDSLTIFFNEKLTSLNRFFQLGEFLTEKQLRETLGLFFFVLYFSYHLLEPEIIYIIEHKFIKELAKLFLVVLKAYGRICQLKENENSKVTKKATSVILEENLTACQTLKCVIFCFSKLRQFSVEFTHQFQQKRNTNHSYPFISLYCEIVLQIQPATSRRIEPTENKKKAQLSIIERMSNNHELHFKKQEFLFTYYEKDSLQTHNFKQIRQEFKESAQKLINKYGKFLNIIDIKATEPLTQYVQLERQQVSKEDIQVSQKELNQLSKVRSSYRLNVFSSERRCMSEDKSGHQISQQLPSIKSAVSPPLSFVQSLKVNIPRPNELLVKSLSSSRRLKKRESGSSSNVKSLSSNEPSQYSQTSLSQKQNSNAALPPFNVPPEFKQVFIERCEIPVFDRAAENVENIEIPLKKTLKRVSRVRNNEMVNRIYINNFVEESKTNMTQVQKISLPSPYNESYRQIRTQVHQEEKKSPPMSSIKRQIQSKSHTPRPYQHPHKQLTYVASVKQFEREEIPEKTGQPKREDSQNDTMCFYYTPRVKKELLKKKILVKKQASIEIGMIANLQEDIVAGHSATLKRYSLMLKIYISALAPLNKVNVNIKFPNWLECVSKANLSKQNLKEQTQFISTFMVQLKATREKIIKRNYGDLPVLNIVFVDRNEKKEVVSEPLYILINRFTIEKSFGDDEFDALIKQDRKVIPLKVHERIGTQIKTIRQYYPSLSLFDLDLSEKMRLFPQQMEAGDSIGVVRLEFVRNHQEMLLIFLQGGYSGERSRTSSGRLLLQMRAVRQEQWGYQDLHIFQTCIRSIFSSDF